MADIVSIRITKNMPQLTEIDEAAKRLGMTRSELIAEGIHMISSWDAYPYSRLKEYSEAFHINIPTMLINMVIKMFAEKDAKNEVWGHYSETYPEFSLTENGPITGEDLYKMIYSMTYNEEVRGRIEMIEDIKKYGLFSDEDKEFYEKHSVKKKPSLQRPKGSYQAKWESEDKENKEGKEGDNDKGKG